MNDILSGLNRAQRDAVTSDASVLQVLAPPGSGKTKTLTARVAYLIAQRGLKPWNIVVCTFTVKAAREMQERIRSFVGEEVEKKLNIGTFHGIAVRYLRKYGKYAGLAQGFGVADTGDSMAIVKRIIKQKDLSADAGKTRSRISSEKSKGNDSAHFAQTIKKNDTAIQEFSQIFSEYQATLAACNLLDYDDLLLRCLALLKTNPECVANIEAVLVDEFQDTNGVQYELMGMFAQRLNFITIVGDPDQSIYGWRSAEIRNLSRMKERWPDTRTINLEENYRSSGAILHAAQEVIEQDMARPPKKLQATHSLGQRPVLRKLPSAKHEADWLAAEIKRVQALTGRLVCASDVAILLRGSAQSRVIETALVKAGLPYRMVGGTRFYDRAEVKIILDYLRVINQPTHSEAIERVINVPTRKIGDKTVESLRDEAKAKNVTLWSLILNTAQGRAKISTKLTSSAQRGIEQFANVILSGQKKAADHGSSLADLISIVMQKLGFQDYIKRQYAEDHESRWANVEELVAQAADASSLVKDRSEPNAEQSFDDEINKVGDIEETPLAIFLANVALTASADERGNGDGEKVQQITISTIHAAKGLEWPVVFIPACYEGSIPHSRAEDMDEERRLLYVGMTRAQALLYLSCPMKNTQYEETTMSNFLTQPGLSNYFEEHGPSIAFQHIQGLAQTLTRECPLAATIEETKGTLGVAEDNYWPVNGEMPIEESNRWNYGRNTEDGTPVFGTTRSAAWVTASTTMGGFTSVKDQYSDLMKKQEELESKKFVKRATDQAKAVATSKGKKRQIDGQGGISSFFTKKGRPSIEPTVPPRSAPAAALRDISNVDNSQMERSRLLPVPQPLVPSAYKPHGAPFSRPTMLKKDSSIQATTAYNDYVFLSSSPTRPETDENGCAEKPETSNYTAYNFHAECFEPA